MINLFPWEGLNTVKPRNFRSTVTIPCKNTPEHVEVAVSLWRKQTIPPYIMIIDTGSTQENIERIKKLKNYDLEVHCLEPSGVNHPSDMPSIACDLSLDLCRTDYLIFTHSDVFPARQDLVKYLISHKEPVVGYKMSEPRQYAVGEKWVDHCLLCLNLNKIGDKDITFSQRRLCKIKKIDHRISDVWMPDTSIMLNICLEKQNIEVKIIGQDSLNNSFSDINIEHIKNLTNSQNSNLKLKAHNFLQKAKERSESWTTKEKPSFAIVTPCSRLRGLSFISDSIFKMRDFFDFKWIVGLDSSKIKKSDMPESILKFINCIFEVEKSCYGAQQKNKGMKLAKEWIYFLDDDNLLHRNFAEILSHLINQYPEKRCFVFDQILPTGRLRLKSKENFDINEIDTGCFVIHKEILEDFAWKEDEYSNDYYFISEIYKKHKDKFIFLDDAITYYNANPAFFNKK